MINCNSMTKLITFKTFIIVPRMKKNIRTEIDKSKEKIKINKLEG